MSHRNEKIEKHGPPKVESVAEAARRARKAADQKRHAEASDRVERASEASFPASDPPGWIWGEPA